MFWPELNSRLLQRENGREQEGVGGVGRRSKETFLGAQKSEVKPSGAPVLAKAVEPSALSTGLRLLPSSSVW